MIFSQTVTKVTASTHCMIYKNELSGENGFVMLLLTIEFIESLFVCYTVLASKV